MEKGTLGIRLCFYTVLGFILAAIGGTLQLFLLTGVVLLVEKNEWATRQLIQAIFLCLIDSVIASVLNEVGRLVTSVSFISNIWYKVDSFVMMVVSIVVFALCIVGILKTIKGEEADIPVASKFADWAYGKTSTKTAA